MTKDASLLAEGGDASAKSSAAFTGQTLEDIIKADRKTNNKKKGRGRGKGKGKGRGRGRGRKRGRGGRGGRGWGFGGGRGRGGVRPAGFYTSGFRQQMGGMMPMHAFAPPPVVQKPLQMMYQLVQKHGLNPTIAVLSTTNESGGPQVQVQVDLDISVLEGKPAGSFGLRQLAWGSNKQDAKRKAVNQMLTHPSLQGLVAQLLPKQQNSHSLFPGMHGQAYNHQNNNKQQKKKKKKNKNNKNKNKQKKNNDEKKKNNPEHEYCWQYRSKKGCDKEDCKWKDEIPPTFWGKDSERAIQLFEAFMTENGKLLSFDFQDDPENEDKFICTCIVDGENQGEGKGTRFEAKTAASKTTYEKFLALKQEEDKAAAEAAAAAKTEETETAEVEN